MIILPKYLGLCGERKVCRIERWILDARAIIMCDPTNNESINHVQKWSRDFKRLVGNNVPIVSLIKVSYYRKGLKIIDLLTFHVKIMRMLIRQIRKARRNVFGTRGRRVKKCVLAGRNTKECNVEKVLTYF